MLLEPILPSPEASGTVFRVFHMIDGKLEKTWGRHIRAQ